MQRKKALLVVLSLVIALTACGGADAPDPRASAGTGAAGIPVTVQNCGRTLTFEQPPSRVVTSYYPTLETLIVLGLEGSVIGRARFSDPDGFLPGHEQIYEAIPEVDENGYATVEELEAAGTFDDLTQIGGGQDDIDKELAQIGAGAQVDDELSKMKAELGSGGGEKPALEEGESK